MKNNITDCSTEYLKRVVDLEKSVYMQSQAINQVSNQINNLGWRTQYQRPDFPGEYSKNILSGTGTFACAGGLIGAIIGIFAGGFINGLIIGAIACILLTIIFNIFEVSSENSERQKNYETELAAYNNAVSDDTKRVNQEQLEKDRLNKLLPIMINERDETLSVLDQYYKKDIIFPKYRNLIAMCSFYEYFVSGRCSSLKGHEGAYNIFENEARLERICTKLDEVVQKLDEIKSNQYILFDAIQEGNKMSQQILQESIKQSRLTEEIAESSAISAQYSQIAANNAEACAWIGMANYIRLESNQ